MSDTSGPTLPEPLAFYDPDSSSWRMSAGTFPWEPPPSLETLPASGMTLGGRLYELPMSAPVTAVPASSSLPTPRVAAVRTSRGAIMRPDSRSAASLEQACEMARGILPRELDSIEEAPGSRQGHVLLPTPTTEPMTGNGHARNLGKEVKLPTPSAIMDAEGTTYRNPRASANFETHHAVTLGQVAYRRFHEDLLPTPRTSDANGTGAHGDGGPDLRTTVDKMLPTPTPTSRDHKGHNQRHDETCLTGALTAPPSPDTPPCSDAPPLTLWTHEDD